MNIRQFFSKSTLRPVNGLAALALGLTCAASFATPVPMGTAQSTDLLYNFNFGANPAAPYTAMDLFLTIAGLDAGELLIFDAFDGLGGSGFFAGSGAGGPANGVLQIGALSTFSQLTDGIFSFGFRLNQGAADITDVYVRATNANGTLSIPGATVPEPTSLALVGLALAGLAAATRRR